MGQLTLVRHGQSMWNAHNRFTGWVDVPLSKKGIAEAQSAGEVIAEDKIDLILMSSLMRAQQTAMIMMAEHADGKTPIVVHEHGCMADWSAIHSPEASANSIPCYIDQRLNERYYGDLQGQNKDDARQQYGADQVQVWRRSYDERPPAGESLEMTAVRVLPCLADLIVPAMEMGRHCLVVAHGNSLRALIMALEELSPQEVMALELPTAQPRSYEYQDGVFYPFD